MQRPISDDEAAVVQWLLEHPGPNEPKLVGLLTPSSLVVVETCKCGCRSVDFVLDRTDERKVRDACTVFSDGVQGGVILWAARNEITALEFYDSHEHASWRMPTVSDLRTWEQIGEVSAQ
jgi:hypothetical protein